MGEEQEIQLPNGQVLVFPAGMSDADIAAAIDADQRRSAPTYIGTGPGGFAMVPEASRYIAEQNQRLAQEAPSLGAIAGASLVGGPVAGVGMAAAGGGLGEWFRQKFTGEPSSLAGMAGQALLQGGFQALGPLAVKAGKGLYKAALRPSVGLRREFGDVAATGLQEGVPVTQQGVGQAERLVSGSRNTAMQMLGEAAPTAPPVTADDVVPALKPTIDTALKQQAVGENPNMPALQQRLRQLSATFGPGADLPTAQTLKETAQDLASTAYRAQDKGAVINSLDAMANKDTAAAIQKAIEARVPGIQQQNRKTRDLLGLLRALEDADLRRMEGPPPGLTSMINRLPTNPGLLSRGGIALDRAGRANPANLARAVVALLEQEQNGGR